ncbi:MAG: hypothetical protein K2H46_02240 [Muribaculaceae bacterium]|nr:hypothetical protein [Muribaculaceae bacterium]
MSIFPLFNSGENDLYARTNIETNSRKEFPILGWLTFYKADDFNKRNIDLLKEGGINISLGPGMNLRNSIKIADSLDNSSVKYLVNCPAVRNKETYRESVYSLMSHPSVIGYFLKDEPAIGELEEWKECKERVCAIDTSHFCLVDLYPVKYPGPYPAPEYKKYLKEYVNLFSPPFFSFDNYCIIEKNGELRVFDNYYENLEIAREVTTETGCPFHTFCLTSPHNNYPTPTINYLTLEAFASLAYGSQGIIYYTVSLDPTRTEMFRSAPLDLNGEPTPTWFMMKEVNRQIQLHSDIFLGCRVSEVWHTGKQIPTGTRPLIDLPTPLKVFKTGEKGVLLSEIMNGEKKYFVVVNHDISMPQTIELKSREKLKLITKKGIEKKKLKSCKYNLEPGGYAIFEIL